MKQPDTIRPAQPRAKADIYLDANESPFNTPDNRYPDSANEHLRELWGRHERIPTRCIYLCNGTEDAIDLCMRIYGTPNRGNVISVAPTRTVYKRRAAINRLEYREVPLNATDFSLNTDAIIEALNSTTQILFLCSPNSPTGNLLGADNIETLLDLYEGVVVVDESYIDFVPQATVINLLNRYKNLIVLRSFSHAWASAGLRLAAVIAHPEVIDRFVCTGLTHPLSAPVARLAEQMVLRRLDVDKWVRRLVDERTKVEVALKELPECMEVYPSVANFLFVRFADAAAVYKYLHRQGIAVRLVHGCLRISIGLPGENSALLGALRRR